MNEGVREGIEVTGGREGEEEWRGGGMEEKERREM